MFYYLAIEFGLLHTVKVDKAVKWVGMNCKVTPQIQNGFDTLLRQTLSKFLEGFVEALLGRVEAIDVIKMLWEVDFVVCRIM